MGDIGSWEMCFPLQFFFKRKRKKRRENITVVFILAVLLWSISYRRDPGSNKINSLCWELIAGHSPESLAAHIGV